MSNVYQKETKCKVWNQLVMSKNMYRFIKGPFENRLLSVFFVVERPLLTDDLHTTNSSSSINNNGFCRLVAKPFNVIVFLFLFYRKNNITLKL